MLSIRAAAAANANLSPACFGLVMATGIVSLAAHFNGFLRIAQTLFAIDFVAWVVLWALTLARLPLHRARFFDDLFDHARGPGFFTAVAATSILGSEALVLGSSVTISTALWATAVVLRMVLTCAIFTGLTVRRDKPGLAAGIHGAWLLAVVATQSIAVLSALLAPQFQQLHRVAINFLALSTWLFGGALYTWMSTLIFYRLTFLPLEPGDLSPPQWINLGAMAISTLAGSELILNVADAPLLQSMLPFIKGATVLCWATGTWWIPMLVVLAVWRHVVRRFPVRYDPLYGGAVFPLGMYGAGTHAMIVATDLAFLRPVPQAFFWIALAAWSAAFAGMTIDVARRLRGADRNVAVSR